MTTTEDSTRAWIARMHEHSGHVPDENGNMPAVFSILEFVEAPAPPPELLPPREPPGDWLPEFSDLLAYGEAHDRLGAAVDQMRERLDAGDVSESEWSDWLAGPVYRAASELQRHLTDADLDDEIVETMRARLGRKYCGETCCGATYGDTCKEICRTSTRPDGQTCADGFRGIWLGHVRRLVTGHEPEEEASMRTGEATIGPATTTSSPVTVAHLITYGPEPSKGILGAEGEMFSEGAAAMIVGRSGTAKTHFATAVGESHVRGGRLGHLPITKGRVLYLSAEMDESQMRRRLAKQFGPAGAEEYGDRYQILCRPKVKLDFFGDVDKSTKQVRNWINGTGATLTFIDALSDCHTGDENSNRDMGGVMRAIRDDIAAPTKSCVVPLHHTGNPSEFSRGARARGASAMRDVVEDMLIIEQSGNSALRIVTFDKTRWGRFEPFGFELVEDPRTGLVRVELRGPESVAAAAVDRKDEKKARAATDAAIALQGKIEKAVDDPKNTVRDCPGVSDDFLSKLCGVDKRKAAYVQAKQGLIEQKVLEAVPGPRNGVYYRRPVATGKGHERVI